VHDADPAHRVPTEPVPHDQTDDLQVPEGAEERSRWLLAGARRLGDAVREAGPQTGGWTWADDKTAGFWLRRITHDTLVHRLDAELAVGREVALAPDLAADSVSDLLEMFSVLPRIDDFPALAGLRGSGQLLHFHATDAGLGLAGEWLARRTPSGVVWEHGHGQSRRRPARPRAGPAAGAEPASPAGRFPAGSLGRSRAARPLAGAQPAGPRLSRHAPRAVRLSAGS
jgi:hypothetical protein